MRRPFLVSLLGLLLLAVGSGQTPAPEAPPRPPELEHNDRGVAAYEAKEFDAAIVAFEEALRIAPADEAIRGNLARALHARALLDGSSATELMGSVSDLRRAEGLLPTEPLIPVLLADYLRRLDDPGGAWATLGAARNRLPRSGRVRLACGEFAYAEERLLLAEEHLVAALELEPELAKKVRPLLDKVRRELVVERDWFTDSRGPFTVKYDDESFRDVGTRVLEILDRAWQDLSTDLRHWPKRRVNVILYTRENYDEATGAHGWTGGLFDGKIRLPVRDFSREEARVTRALRHELTHWFVRDLCPRCPLWLNEGMAQLVEGHRFDERRRARLRALKKLPSVTRLPGQWAAIPERDRVLTLYAHALGFTAFLVERGGRDTVGDVLRALAEGATTAEAVEKVLDRPLQELEEAFRATL